MGDGRGIRDRRGTRRGNDRYRTAEKRKRQVGTAGDKRQMGDGWKQEREERHGRDKRKEGAVGQETGEGQRWDIWGTGGDTRLVGDRRRTRGAWGTGENKRQGRDKRQRRDKRQVRAGGQKT